MTGLPLKAGTIDLNDFKKDSPINVHQRRRYDLVEKLFSRIPKLGQGLDYGCGLGDQVYYFSGKFEKIIGVDVTPERVDWANKEFAPLEFQVCAPDSLSFDDNTFDVVLSSVVLNWVDDTDEYLRNAHRVLVPGGHLVLLVKAPNILRNGIRRLLGKPPVFENRHMQLDVMKSTLTTIGFTIVDTGFFYDSVSALLTNPKNILLEAVRLPMRALGLAKYAHYYGILARKVA